MENEMSKKKLIISVLAVGLSLVSGYASAEWNTKVDDDVFTGGHTAMLAGGDTALNGVIFDCAKDKLSVTYIERGETKDVTEGVPVNMVFKIDQNPPIKFDAFSEVRNNDFFGIKAENNDAIRLLLNQLRAAKHRVLLGVQSVTNEQKQSYAFSTEGSSGAVNKFIKACEIDLPKVVPVKN
jgi:hypothetical protein